MTERSHRKLDAAGLAGGAAFAIVSGFASAARLGATSRMNDRVRQMVRPKRRKTITRLAEGVSYAGAPYIHPLLAIGLAAVLRAIRGRTGVSIIAASLGAMSVDQILRLVVHQERPPKSTKHHGSGRFAYPSGHTSAITAIGITAAQELSDHVSPTVKTEMWLSVAGASLLMGWSRLYLDEHWADDVIGGLAAGATIGVAAGVISESLSAGDYVAPS